MYKFYLFFMVFCFKFLPAQEVLHIDIISYDKLVANDSETLKVIQRALHDKGIIGVSGVPNFKESYDSVIRADRTFHKLPKEIKITCSPDRESGDILGYEFGGIEKFQREDGTWEIDELKNSYYFCVGDNSENKWPKEMNLEIPLMTMATKMVETGKILMRAMGLIDDAAINSLGRMLYYKKGGNSSNPQWCGEHFDHSMMTALLPATYFFEEKEIEEPQEAGLYVRRSKEESYKKVMIADRNVILFQVGEFAQLISDDKMIATKHFVHKSNAPLDRCTMAVFIEPLGNRVVHSKSVLTNDARYKEPFTYEEWAKNSYDRYLVKK